MKQRKLLQGRRKFLKTAAGAAALTTGALHAPYILAQASKIKVGLMLPYTGTYAQLGIAITDAFKLHVNENGGMLGGRGIEFAQVDDESEPAKATDNANRLIEREKVDVLVGTVHSGVAMAMAKVSREAGVLTICPNAGADALTAAACAPTFFRTSFSNWQPAYPMGKVLADRGVKNVVTLTWKYAAGEESINGFKEGFAQAGGKVTKELTLPFPQVEFQALLTEIASLKPDAVFVFFAGGGAVKFVKDYAAAGLRKTIPLYGSGFLTDGTLQAQGEAAQGLETTLHYGDSLILPKNLAFREMYNKATGREADVYAVQGYDAAQLLRIGLEAVRGDIKAKKHMIPAMERAEIDSPRGKFTLSKAHNPVQDIYLRKAVGLENKVQGVAHKALADPARGCKMT
ncbi:MAG TPA: ABC transporter substrate-binding protein [Burkholderiales bacterium]|nr:ABC transporter substrate-binding protein [Burkholderiales bacterium]